MTRIRSKFVSMCAVIAIGAGVGVVGKMSTASSATAPKTYSLTIAGTDMHSLDPRLQPKFVDGGGVIATFDDSRSPQGIPYFEAGLDLPVGAKVTSITAVARVCYPTSPTVVFGSYSPSTRNTIQNATLSFPTNSGCLFRTVNKSGNPITTVAAGRRYALDYSPQATISYPGYDLYEAFFGATVKYTCASPCVP